MKEVSEETKWICYLLKEKKSKIIPIVDYFILLWFQPLNYTHLFYEIEEQLTLF